MMWLTGTLDLHFNYSATNGEDIATLNCKVCSSGLDMAYMASLVDAMAVHGRRTRRWHGANYAVVCFGALRLSIDKLHYF